MIRHLTTSRLVARPLLESDFDLLCLMDSDPRVMNTLGGIRSEEKTAAYIRNNLMHWEEHGYGLWILQSREDEAFVGRAALRHVEIAGNDEIEVGYALIPDFWGVGLATEIARAILDVAFNQLQLSDVVAFTLPDNMASRNVIEKIGGVFECDTTYKEFPHVLYRIEPSNSLGGTP